MSLSYDVIIVGARCAGSPTALLLARSGLRILVVDRAGFPSDTISTHVLHPPGVAALARWGILDSLVATGCPAIHTYSFDFGPFTISGTPGTREFPVAYCPRRTVLDKLLVDAAGRAGAEIREHCVIDGLLTDNGRVVGVEGHTKTGARFAERARVVVGADGRNSFVAKTVRPARYEERSPLLATYYTYFSDLPVDGCFETYIRLRRGFAVAPSHDGLTVLVGGWPFSEFEANRGDVESNFLKALDQAPAFAARVRSARREANFAGATVSNFFHQPFGPGWALVGDAGYNRDPITAQGISDAFVDAERCAQALIEALAGARPFEEAMSAYQSDRDRRALPMYQFTCQLAMLEPPPAETAQLLRAVHGNRAAMDDFVRTNAGTISPAVFFAPENVGRILANAVPDGSQ